MNERTFPASGADRLDDPERRRWLPPEEVVARLGLREGMRVADVGAGTGYFTLPMAAAVGASGSVDAVDLQPAMLERLRGKLRHPAAPANVRLHDGDAARTGLEDAAVDLYFLANVYHELDARPLMLQEARRVLRPGGRLAILDWRADLVPPPGPPAEHRMPVEQVLRELMAADWRTGYPDRVGRYSYLVIAFR